MHPSALQSLLLFVACNSGDISHEFLEKPIWRKRDDNSILSRKCITLWAGELRWRTVQELERSEFICRQEFSFLADLGFEVASSTKDDNGCSIKYKSRWAALDVRLDLQGPGIVIDCYKLKEGEIPPYPIFFNPTAEFLVFDFNDFMIMRTGQSIQQDPAKMYDEKYMREKMRQFAQSLRQYAGDILSGDFTACRSSGNGW